MDTLPGISFSWTASVESPDNFLRYHVYRRELGETDWELRKVLTTQDYPTYEDYEVESGVTYEYTVTQWSDSTGEEIESDYATEVQLSITFSHMFLHDRYSPDYYAGMFISSQRISGPKQDVKWLQPYNLSKAIAHIGNQLYHEYSVSLEGQWDHDNGGLSREQYDALVALIGRQKSAGSVLVARQHSIGLLICQIDASGLDRQDRERGFSQTLRMREANATLVTE